MLHMVLTLVLATSLVVFVTPFFQHLNYKGFITILLKASFLRLIDDIRYGILFNTQRIYL